MFLFQHLVLCRRLDLSHCWKWLVGCPLCAKFHSQDFMEVWEMHVEGLKSQHFTKGMNQMGKKVGRTSDWKIGPCLIIIWQRDVKPWLNLFITVYCYFLNLIFQCEKMKKKFEYTKRLFFLLKASSFFCHFFSSSVQPHFIPNNSPTHFV